MNEEIRRSRNKSGWSVYECRVAEGAILTKIAYWQGFK